LDILAPEIDELVDQLGGSVETLRPSLANVIAGFILGSLTAAGGLTLLGSLVQATIVRGGNLPLKTNVRGEIDWTSVGVGSVLGLALMGIGIGIILFVRRLRNARVVICRDGFLQEEGDNRSACRWDEITEVREVVVQEYFPLKGPVKYVAPVGKSRKYIIVRREGPQFEFTGNTVQKIMRLGKMIQAEAGKRGIPCTTENVSG
jgi:hypothetical protein